MNKLTARASKRAEEIAPKIKHMLSQGHSVTKICDELGICTHTAHAYLNKVYGKSFKRKYTRKDASLEEALKKRVAELEEALAVAEVKVSLQTSSAVLSRKLAATYQKTHREWCEYINSLPWYKKMFLKVGDE